MTLYARLTKSSLNVAGCWKRDTLFKQTVWMLAASVCVCLRPVFTKQNLRLVFLFWFPFWSTTRNKEEKKKFA